ncbi:hypothetical protein Slin15195_G064840 [Septoria linicola]|uniref:Rhodopsin domain-containing protein n=1 Tax=Septoria linicola TaxID=215465 RepID=A0A9Q9AQD5_9PEZI|nr:hypothetical protein Slin14017_G115180 [Septoria linicola]USW53165.1 hypothetical protein Slin15195_G064840 [Septoria linicola]
MSRFTKRQEMAPPPDPAYCAESNAHEILGVTGVMMTMAVIVCGLRLMVRACMIKSVGSDDYVMLSALLMAIGTFICFVGETKDANANGRHIQCITPDEYQLFAKWQYVHSLVVMWGVILVKISIALFLMRLAPPGKKWKAFLWATIVFLICFMLACTGTLVFQCWPIKAAWTFALGDSASCFSNDTFSAIGLTNSSINCATDFLLAALPIPVIIKLQVNRRTKITLAVILSLGYFACAAGIVKAVKQASFFDEADPLWHNSFNVWNMIELCVGITAASLPALRPLFAQILASTKDALSHSVGSKDRTVPSSSGYHRHTDKDQYTSLHDVALLEMKNMSRSSKTDSMTKSHMTKPSVDDDPLFPTDPKRYTVGVTSAQDPGDDGSWEDIEVAARSQSQERLTRPYIFKTTEVTSTSHRADGLLVSPL